MAAKRTRLTAAVALAAAVVIASVVAVAGGSGGGGGEGSLAWQGKVQVIDSDVKTDRILYTKVENTSLEDVDLVAKEVRALDAEGREVQSSTSFLAAFAHGIYPWAQRKEMGEFERRRLGQIATIKPGEWVPVTLAWRVPEGGKQPVKVDFGPAEIALP